MKKIYLFLALVLALVGFGVSRAWVTTVDGMPVSASELEDGARVFIGCDITNYNGSVGNHTFGNYNVLQDNGSGNAVMPYGSTYELDDATPQMVWELVEARTDEDGKWFYLKNVASGLYISYDANPYNQDISDVDALPDEYSDGVWYKEDWLNNTVIANCEIPLTLVEAQADAKPFVFMKPSEGVQLMGCDYHEHETVMDLIATVDESHLIMIAKLEVSGQTIYAASNVACNGGLSRYGDWAVYYRVLEASCYEEPTDALEEFLNGVTLPEYQYGDHPGCVVEAARAQYVKSRLEEIRAELDNEHSNDEWSALLAEAQALVAEAEGFTFIPMSAGYYRFISALPGYEQTQGVKKAMYSEDGKAKWGNLDEGTADTGMEQIWVVVEDVDGHFYVRNLKTGLYFDVAARQSEAVTMSATPTWVMFTMLSGGDFNMHVKGSGYALHTGGHGMGSGVSGNIVGWNAGSGTGSAWNMMPVSEEDIVSLYGEDVFDNARLMVEFNQLLFNAKSVVAKAKATASKPLVTSASQISSPMTETREGSIGALIDGNYDTFWHSQWTSGTVNDNEAALSLHYLQFDLGQAVRNVTMKYARRVRVLNDHPTEFTIWGSNEADGEFVEVSVFDVDADGGSGSDEVTYSYELDFGAEYRYVRVRATMTDFWKGYWHAAEMNFYVPNEFNLWAKAEPFASELEEAIAEAEALTVPTREGVDALRAAYDAFLAVYTDPTALNNLLAEAKTMLASVEYGDEVGQKPESARESLSAAIANAEEWLAANLATCTKAELTEQEEALQEAIDTWNAVALNPDVPTAIESVTPTINVNTMYDLSGRSVSRAGKGLYIVNGKKVVVK